MRGLIYHLDYFRGCRRVFKVASCRERLRQFNLMVVGQVGVDDYQQMPRRLQRLDDTARAGMADDEIRRGNLGREAVLSTTVCVRERGEEWTNRAV